MDKKIPTLAGSLTFFICLNGGSLLFLYIILSNFLPFSFIDILLEKIEDGNFKDFLSYFFDYQNSISYSVFLIITSVYSASSLYYHLMHISELIGGCALDRSVSKRLSSIISTLIFLVVIFLISIGSSIIIFKLPKYSTIIFSLTIIFIFLFIIYGINLIALKSYRFKKIYKGAIFTVLYFLIFTIGFFIYLNIFSNFKIVYGVLSFFIILMFYLYILAIGLVLGIYINCKNLDLLHYIFSKDSRN